MPIPRQLGIYTIEAHLGGGRFAEVYQASDPVRKRTVALKVLKINALPDGLSPRRTLEQALRAAELVHPYLAWVWETGEADGAYFLVERFIGAPSLAHILSTSEALDWTAAESVLQQVAQGLDYAHTRGYAHGDVKPSNILVSPEFGAVLTDFGLSMALQGGHSTPQYKAPELWAGEAPSPASDQYALACVLSEMLSGEKLFDGASPDEMHARHLQERDAFQMRTPAMPWQVTPPLQRALSGDPARRFPTAVEFAEAPSRLAAGAPQQRQQIEIEAEKRRQAEQETRQQAEESARLAALEQARREVREQLREVQAGQPQPISSERPGEAVHLPTPVPPALAQPAALPASPAPRRRAAHAPPKSIRRAGTGVLLLLIVLGGAWASQRIPWQAIFPPTATSTPTATRTPAPSHTPTPTATGTATLTPTASATATLTPRPTFSPTVTLTPTVTEAPTLAPSPTRTPRLDLKRDSESRGTGGP